MDRVKSVEELEVFKRAHALAVETYRITGSFPVEERYGLVSQMRRSAASVGANLMEGGHRTGTKEFRHFVNIAKGSLGEWKYHLLLAKDLGLVTLADHTALAAEAEQVSKVLHGLIQSLSRKDTGNE